MFSNHQ